MNNRELEERGEYMVSRLDAVAAQLGDMIVKMSPAERQFILEANTGTHEAKREFLAEIIKCYDGVYDDD